MAVSGDAAYEHDIELPVQLDPEDLQDRWYRAAASEYADRPWAKALQAVLDEPMPKPPKRVTRDLYRSVVAETWQQRGQECTGFALAAIATFHLRVERIYRALVTQVIEPPGGPAGSNPNQLDVVLRRLLTERLAPLNLYPDDPTHHKRIRIKLGGRDQWWQFRVAATALFSSLQSQGRAAPCARDPLDEALNRHGWNPPDETWAGRVSGPLRTAEWVLRKDPLETAVSRRMLYEMAQVYDGRDFPQGATLRGALRGWNRLGVASESAWRYAAGDEEGQVEGGLGLTRILDAARRPGGYYFRIDPSDLPAMKKALARGGGSYPLLCSARLHDGWFRLFLPGAGRRPVIERRHGDEPEGLHAFAIVGYDDDYKASREPYDRQGGFWVHNSWGEQWGDGGYGFLRYDDWLRHGGDVWVVIPRPTPTLTDPTDLKRVIGEFVHLEFEGRRIEKAKSSPGMWPHLVPIGDDGRLVTGDPHGIDADLVKTLLYLFQEHTSTHDVPRLAIFADGGYLPREHTVGMLTAIRTLLMRQRIYPLFLVWDTEWWTVTGAWIEQLISASVDATDWWSAGPRSPEMSEIVADSFAPRAWKEYKRRAGLAVDSDLGAARLLADAVSFKWDQQRRRGKPFQIHLIGHGSGAVLLGELARLLPVPITSCTLWAPAMTMRRFDATFRPMLDDGRLGHMRVFALDDANEMARGVRNVLYLISNILEFEWSWKDREAAFRAGGSPHRPEPLLGMAQYLLSDRTIGRLQGAGKLDVRLVDNPVHAFLLADAAGMSRLNLQTLSTLLAGLLGGDAAEIAVPEAAQLAQLPRQATSGATAREQILVGTIEHITSFKDPPRGWRPRTKPRRVDPLVRAEASVPLSGAGPPGGLLR